MSKNQLYSLWIVLGLFTWNTPAAAEDPGAMLQGLPGVTIKPLLTVGDEITGYWIPGLLDGLGAYNRDHHMQLLANHEIMAGEGYPYQLENGTTLTGARISEFHLDKKQLEVVHAGLAFKRIFDRNGKIVTHAEQVSGGLSRFCSARAVRAGEYGFVDDLYFAGEEIDNGTLFALDVQQQSLWAVPALGRAAFESVTPVKAPDPGKVALLVGDDMVSAPLYLYTGEKDAVGDQSLLDRNGLQHGRLYCWASTEGLRHPLVFKGTGSSAPGEWIALEVRDPARAGETGHDVNGYLDADTLRHQARGKGCFVFSRPEDVHENPADPNQAVFASTGAGTTYPDDNWGTIYIINVQTAKLEILLDSDDPGFRDMALRNPDNLVWAENGRIYIQEDRATHDTLLNPACKQDRDCLDTAFGGYSGMEASIWEVIPGKPVQSVEDLRRLAVVDRKNLPHDQYDHQPEDIGNWETSGIIDVSAFLERDKNETLLTGTVQAHSVTGERIQQQGLVEGGQLFLMSVQPIRGNP